MGITVSPVSTEANLKLEAKSVLLEVGLLNQSPTAIYKIIGAKMIKIKGRNVYRDSKLIGKIVGDRFGEKYRQAMKTTCNFAYIPLNEGIPDYENRIDLSMMAYYRDTCDWLRDNL